MKLLKYALIVGALISPFFTGFTNNNALAIPLKPFNALFDTIPELPKGYVPDVYDHLIEDRLQCLQQTIPFPYHPSVKKFVNRYLVKDREQTRIFLSRKSRYFPIFEAALKRHNMPDEIKYLSIVESALQTRVQSWAAAMGLWQFVPATGKEYGLYQDFYIDERMDPYEATEAACRYLKMLHGMFGDWHLALAAYNCGQGRVMQAVRRAGGGTKSFWEVYNFLPGETRAYVPMFIAMNYVMNYYDDHFLPEPEKFLAHIPSDTVTISGNLVSLDEFAKQISVSLETMQELNPHLKKNMVPQYMKNYQIRVPAEKKSYVLENKPAILLASLKKGYRPLPFIAAIPQMTLAQKIKGKKKITHNVVYNESLGGIALKYKTNIADIQLWNKMPKAMVYPNQKLTVYVTPTKEEIEAEKVAKLAQNTKSTAKTGAMVLTSAMPQSIKFHIVQKGDTLWDISRKYQGLSVDKIKQLNPDLKGDNLVMGQKIRVD